jgi:putative flippase GtrA
MKLRVPAWAEDFLRFGVVGTVGFCVSVCIIYAVRGFMNLYAAGVLAWMISVTVTWWLNR